MLESLLPRLQQMCEKSSAEGIRVSVIAGYDFLVGGWGGGLGCAGVLLLLEGVAPRTGCSCIAINRRHGLYLE
jgi:hypothetical protein